MYKLLLCSVCVVSAFGITCVNMQDFYDDAKRDALIEEVGQSLRECGCFAIENTCIGDDVIDDAYEALEAFFQCPIDVKRQCFAAHDGVQRGFIDTELIKGEKEYFHVGQGDNVWPNEGNMQEVCSKYFECLEVLAADLQQVISLAMGQDAGYLSGLMENCTTTLRMAYYFANPSTDEDWSAAHTDVNFFTILPRQTAAGLQVLDAREWVAPEGAFIINAGDMLRHVSNGEFEVCVHRVVPTSKEYDRYSTAMFVQPNYHTDLTPNAIALERTGQEVMFDSCSAGELFVEQFLALGSPSAFSSPDLTVEALTGLYNSGFASASEDLALSD